MTLLAGAAEVVITPPVGTALDGYGGRTGGSVAVHDDLHARAIVVDDGVTQAAIVGCDLIGVDRRLVAAARERASAATGIPAAHIMIAATHTHAGPAGLRRDLDEALTDVTARAIAGAIAAAHRDRRPAVLKAGRGSVDSVSQNRRDPAGPYDDTLRVLLFDAPDPRDGAIAAIVNFACHATVLFSTNMAISADYPGYAVRTVQQIIGGAPVVFLNGACGDVNPAWIEQRYDEAARVGSIVGAEAARRLQELRPLGAGQKVWNIRWDELTGKAVPSGELIAAPAVRVASRSVAVPLRALDPPGAYDRRIADLERRLGDTPGAGLAHEGEAAHRRGAASSDPTTVHDGPANAPGGSIEGRRRAMEQMTRYRTERGVAERLGPGAAGKLLHPEVQAIALGGGCVVLGLPGECFAETGQAVQAAAGLPHLLVACYANHYVGYLVPRHAFAEGGYEPGAAMLDETAEQTMRTAAIELVRSVLGSATDDTEGRS
ncbi:MAG: neutral/alkaline non-lysosomal ceramidase N-terminal domain-containing protein [Chloroflexota bacterium]|nr:neutral/alkaline non-lysosomal ceramidase N-terminal domain-containing protein [Chloroflexota bacterium]